jgi:hypothetical protein
MSGWKNWVDTEGNAVDPAIALVGNTALDWLDALAIPTVGIRVYAYESQHYHIVAQDNALRIRTKSGPGFGEILHAEVKDPGTGTMVSHHVEIDPVHVARFESARQWLTRRHRSAVEFPDAHESDRS